MDTKILDTLLDGTDHAISDAAKEQLKLSIQTVSKQLEDTKINRTSAAIFGKSSKQATDATDLTKRGNDTEMYTTISEMINGSTKDPAGFGTLLDSLYMKNKKYFSIIKDYEIMPILIPQINRVLMFLVNECLSPDIQNDHTFNIKYIPEDDEQQVQADIDAIKKEMKLDNMLREVYMNRYKLGCEYYLVVDYNKTFDHMLEMIHQKGLNESTAGMTDISYLDEQYKQLTTSVTECSATLNLHVVSDDIGTGTRDEKETIQIKESAVEIKLTDMNIQIDRSPIARYVAQAHGELLSEAYSRLSMDSIMTRMVCTGSLNEAVVDTSKLETLVGSLKKKKLQKCMIERLDPAKIFKLKIGGKVIGYFHVTDINGNTSNVINLAQSLKNQLLKTKESQRKQLLI